ncbi:hypothetical protein TNIN_422301 [Trichonephila inaurata madagascariensis]|uniref:Uncharacterized protein n=1 Tax=Trichonephila inaurata madagascariensis TaxID=2747483 RepID=A0A8X7BNW8_9ARAC|nr:hypothetical protein TNIN_422301 [Trichonephila inaurata madagascariensis]
MMVGRVRGYTGIRLPLQTGHYSRYPLGCGGIRTNKKLREWNRTKAKFVSVNHGAGDKSTLSCHVIEDSSLEGGKGPSNLRKTCVVISLLIGSFLRCGVSLLLSLLQSLKWCPSIPLPRKVQFLDLFGLLYVILLTYDGSRKDPSDGQLATTNYPDWTSIYLDESSSLSV